MIRSSSGHAPIYPINRSIHPPTHPLIQSTCQEAKLIVYYVLGTVVALKVHNIVKQVLVCKNSKNFKHNLYGLWRKQIIMDLNSSYHSLMCSFTQMTSIRKCLGSVCRKGDMILIFPLQAKIPMSFPGTVDYVYIESCFYLPF